MRISTIVLIMFVLTGALSIATNWDEFSNFEMITTVFLNALVLVCMGILNLLEEKQRGGKDE